LDRRTDTPDSSGGASPTVVTERQDDDDLMADTDEPAQILGTSPVRTATRSAAKEASANGSSVADGKDAAADDVPALPADSIGSPRDSFAFSRSAPAPVSPGVDDWTSAGGVSSSAAAESVTPEGEPAPTETGTGWPADGTMFGTGADTATAAGDSSLADPPAAQQSTSPEAATVSAAAFVWDPPEPAPTSSSSPARNFLRSSASANAPAPPRPPAVSADPANAQAGRGAAAASGAAVAAGPRPKGSSRRSARQAHLTVARVEPWSVMKFSFVVSLVAFVILFVAVSVIYGTLSALGVFTSLQHVVQSVTSSQDSGGVNAAKWFTESRVLSYTALLGALNIVLITAMCTIGAVVYNLTSRLIGGVEVTLRETE
jgi:hypothetical protein